MAMTQPAASESVILTINAGSSSLRCGAFGFHSGGADARQACVRLLAIHVDGADAADSAVTLTDAHGRSTNLPGTAPDPPSRLARVMDALQQAGLRDHIAAVGHRVVHGGPRFWAPARIDDAMLAALQGLSPFDPTHLPQEIAYIKLLLSERPEIAHVACFDTAFHRDLPVRARLLPIPRRFEREGVRRYGFHGLSFSFIMSELARLGEDRGRLVLAHLGGGASMAAVRDGRSIDTTMAMTPTAGLVMGARSGDLDPGLAGYFARAHGLDAQAFSRMAASESGMLGVSETSADVRKLLAREADDERARDALELFAYSASKHVGALAAALEGLDGLVFAGGIGENASDVRRRICAPLGFLGVELDPARNAAGGGVISSDASRVRVRVVRTDEELFIARCVHELIFAKPKAPG